MAFITAQRTPRAGRSAAVATTPRPRLTVLAKPEPSRSALPFALLCSLIAVATLMTMLILNVQMGDTSFEITRLQAQSQRLDEQEQALTERAHELDTPQQLATRAREIGMVPVNDPAYIDLATGDVVGNPEPAAGAAPAADTADPVVPAAGGTADGTTYRGMGGEGN